MSAEFLGSFVGKNPLPDGNEPRVAFLGRSNVGKSSLINLLSNSQIARVSKTPGRTQTLNLFLVNKSIVFGDFPGYGFAKVSQDQRREFQKLIETFLNSQYFQYAIQIMDARHPGMEADINVYQWLRDLQIPTLVVLNKSDKLNQKERAEAERKAKKMFPDQPLLFASSFTLEGKRELEKLLRKITTGDAAADLLP